MLNQILVIRKRFAKLYHSKWSVQSLKLYSHVKWSVVVFSYCNYKNVHSLTFNNLHNQWYCLFMWMISQNKIQFNQISQSLVTHNKNLVIRYQNLVIRYQPKSSNLLNFVPYVVLKRNSNLRPHIFGI